MTLPRAARDYEELHVRLSPGPNGVYNVALASVTGEAHGEFSLPLGYDELAEFRRAIDPRSMAAQHGAPAATERARALGRALFDALTATDAVGLAFASAKQGAADRDKGLRIKLYLHSVPALAEVPWELLHQQGYVALSRETPIVRYVDLAHARPPLPVDGPIRILGMVSRPVGAGLDDLDADAERGVLEEQLAPHLESGELQIQWLPDGTLESLRRAVDHGEDFHIFHYVGHGKIADRGESVLILERPDGRAYPVTGEDLGTLLCDTKTLRLAVLNACEAATTAAHDPLAGVAAGLVVRDVPAVVAMQFPITDHGAVAFADELYASLSRALPVDTAVALARRRLAAAGGIEWATPVLFMRVADGRLFDLAPSAAVATADPSPPVRVEEQSPATTQRPEHARACDEGSRLYERGDIPSALMAWRRAVDLGSSNAAYYIGEHYRDRGDAVRARQAYWAAGPHHEDAVRRLRALDEEPAAESVAPQSDARGDTTADANLWHRLRASVRGWFASPDSSAMPRSSWDELAASAYGGQSLPPRLKARYGGMTATEVIAALDELTTAELRQLHRYEARHRNRRSVLAAIDALLPDGVPPEGASRQEHVDHTMENLLRRRR